MTWEYFTTILFAKVEEQREEMERRFPTALLPKYSPQALIPQLDEIGAKGWELVSLQPFEVGGNHDIMVHQTGAAVSKTWTYSYLAVFKRPAKNP